MLRCLHINSYHRLENSEVKPGGDTLAQRPSDYLRKKSPFVWYEANRQGLL